MQKPHRKLGPNARDVFWNPKLRISGFTNERKRAPATRETINYRCPVFARPGSPEVWPEGIAPAISKSRPEGRLTHLLPISRHRRRLAGLLTIPRNTILLSSDLSKHGNVDSVFGKPFGRSSGVPARSKGVLTFLLMFHHIIKTSGFCFW